MITENILIALITGGLSFAGVVITNNKSNRKNAIEQAKRDTRLEDTIKELTKRVDSHNGYAKLFSKSKESICLLQKDVEYIRNDIKELKNIPLCKASKGK